MSLMIGKRVTPQPQIRLKCACGRDLRARLEQAGSEITCWSCHAQVPVPVPVAPGAWVARLLTVTARQILASRTFTLLAIGAAMVTLALSITGLGLRLSPRALAWMPYPGVFAAAVALALVMVGYGELVRRGSQGDWTSAPSVGPWLRGWRGVLCLGVGVALVMPLIMATQNQTTPKLTPSGLVIALAATFVLPLVMLWTYVPNGSVLDRVRLVGSIVRRHPGALLASLLIVPVSLPAIEGLVWVLARVTSTFSFMLFDLFPPREEIRTVFRLPYYTIGPSRIKWLEFREASDALIMGTYGSSLRQGYALLGAIPASLAMHTSNGYFLESVGLHDWSYLAYRMFFTLVIVTGMLSALAVQARWLGLLTTVDSRRSASSGSTGLLRLPNLTPESP
jgi:hypothetical protein